MKRQVQVATRLGQGDVVRFRDACAKTGLTAAEFARVAILAHMDSLEKEQYAVQESKVEARLKRMESRLAALLARNCIDTGLVYTLIYNNMEPETRDGQVNAAYKHAVERIKKKVSELDEQVSGLVK